MLLNRIAHSNGDLQRTVLALRLINEHLEHELGQCPAHSDAGLCPTGLSVRLDQTQSKYSHITRNGKEEKEGQ